MTNEETIEYLKWIRPKKPWSLDKKNTQIAIDKAINALEHEPCEDCISRQVVLDKAKYWIAIKETETGIIEKRGYYVDVDDVEELPPATPQPKIGHWICELEDWNKWTCSECGWSKRTDVHVKLGYKYCPNCGASMVEPHGRRE